MFRFRYQISSFGFPTERTVGKNDSSFSQTRSKLHKKELAPDRKTAENTDYEPNRKAILRDPRRVKKQFPASYSWPGLTQADEQDWPPRVLEKRWRAWACRHGLAARGHGPDQPPDSAYHRRYAGEPLVRPL